MKKNKILKEYNANKSEKEQSKQEPVKEVKKEVVKEEPKPEPVKEVKKSEPVKEVKKPEPVKKVEPKPEPVKKEEPKKPEPVKEVKKPEPKKPEPVKKVESKPEPVKKEEPKKPETSSNSVADQPPKEQTWNRGDLLSSCCKDYYNLVRSDKSNINWVLLKHESNTKVRAEATGTGSVSEVLPHLTEKDTAFVYIRFQTGDEESIRSKFVLISWCGSKAPIMRKAKMSVHKADVKDIFYSSAVEIHATEHNEINENEIKSSLIKAGGANYHGQAN